MTRLGKVGVGGIGLKRVGLDKAWVILKAHLVAQKIGLESVRQPCDHPNRTYGSVENDPLLHWPTEAGQAINHALIARPLFIHQTEVPVSLELKDTEVRAYRTDPVQVRSWQVSAGSFIILALNVSLIFDVGRLVTACSHWP